MSVHSSHASSHRRARWSEGAGRRLRRALATLVAAAIAVLGLGITTPAAADELTFVSTWEPANTSTGSSNSNQVRLPLTSTGTYDFSVDWGDGTVEQITEYNQPEVTHSYANEETRTITITGTIDGFRFDNNGDRLKITDISSWGPLALGNSGGYFHGAANLTVTATDSPELADTTNLSNAFLGAESLTGDFSQWDVSGVTNMRSMFEGATVFNADIGMWDVASVVTMRLMFQDAAAFDVDLSTWNTAAVTSMRSMFDGATSFDRDLGLWDVSNVADMSDMFAGGEDVGLSLDNYSSLLQGWAALPVQPGVDFDAGDSYFNPTTSQAARGILTGDNSWTISDAGSAGVPSWPVAPTPAAASGSESASVTWAEPNSNHSAITEYTVTAQPGGQTCTVAAPTLTCDVTGLSNGTGYRFSVTATNAVGTSAASPLSNSVTPQTTQPSTPAKPVAAALNESATVWVSRGSGGGVAEVL